MKYERKYMIGEPITSLDELMEQDFVYMFDHKRPKHIAWVQNLQLRLVNMHLKRGMIFKAVKIEGDDDEN